METNGKYKVIASSVLSVTRTKLTGLTLWYISASLLNQRVEQRQCSVQSHSVSVRGVSAPCVQSAHHVVFHTLRCLMTKYILTINIISRLYRLGRDKTCSKPTFCQLCLSNRQRTYCHKLGINQDSVTANEKFLMEKAPEKPHLGVEPRTSCSAFTYNSYLHSYKFFDLKIFKDGDKAFLNDLDSPQE